MIDISDLGLGDTVRHIKYGEGKVLACTERPSIVVRFTNTLKTFNIKNIKELTS